MTAGSADPLNVRDFLSAVVNPPPKEETGNSPTAVEIRAIHSQTKHVYRSFMPPSAHTDEFFEGLEHEGYHIYFGAAPRVQIDGEWGGEKRHCLTPTCLFLDFDNVADIDHKLSEVDSADLPPPSAVVHSGGGLHVYWLLDERINRRDWESRQEKLVLMFPTADQQVKNIDRILRVPGYLNHKRQRPAELLYLSDRRHSPAAFPTLTPGDRQAASDGRTNFIKMEKVEAGLRDNYLFHYALRLWKKFMMPWEVDALTHLANDTRCIPPCPADDVDEKIKNARKYFDTNHNKNRRRNVS